MSFSMFCRGAGAKLLGQQMIHPTKMHMAPISSSISWNNQQHSSNNSTKNPALTHSIAKTTPLGMETIRSFKTSAVCMGEKPHDHAKLWVIEKATNTLMLGIIPLGLIMPNKLIDIALAILITAHSHWGLEAIAVDYIRASIFGPVIPKIAVGLVYLFSIATLAGLLYLITHDVGFANAIRLFWAVKPQQQLA